MASPDIVVVGAGIIGASTAWHLRRAGAAVLLLERDRPASGGTGRSAAAVRQNYSSTLMARLALRSIEAFRRMAEELGADGGYVAAGYHMLVPAEMVPGLEANLAVQRSVGVRTGFMSEAEIAARLPWLNREGIAAVTWEPDGGYADPVRSTEAYVGAFERHGGTFRGRTPVRALLREGSRVTGVVTDEGPIACGDVVNAAGPWAPFLAASAGIDLPMRSVREQDSVWEARPNRPLPEATLALAIDGVYVRPLGERRYVVGRGFPKEYLDCDPYNFKQTADPAFLAEVSERLERRIPAFAGSRLVDSYASLYDVTPDWHPFIGPRREVAGYWDANGGSGHGFKFGPAFGESLARWMLAGEVEADFSRLSHDRLADGRSFTQTFGGNRG
ncbi:MAG: FAD-binding oxidoreductase [Dongiaceae bacterium]